MCGIAAIVGREPVSSADGWRMLETIRHRGPDGMGVATFRPDGVAVEHFAGEPAAGDVVLAHARLAIIDLSSAGFQPMTDADERVWVTFNGEIFNFQELRAELQSLGHSFASRTDTEVLVHGWKQWDYGLLERIEGMFAFALHDRRDGRTVLVRDRLGIKPLYYAERPDGALVAASEVKALLACGIEARLDPAGLDAYLRWRFVPDPQTTFLGVRKLEPGTALEIRDGRTSLRRYWQFRFDAAGPRTTAEELREAVDAAVARQLVADVPLGAFFSGGIDSTAIVESMRRHMAPLPPACFTVGFSDRDLAYDVVGDDLRYARRYGRSAGVDYREAILQPDLADSLPRVVWHMDEPIADPAALSAYHIAREASRDFTVLMSGMGGDELFGGYPRYVAAALAHRLRHVPAPVRRGAAWAAGLLPAAGAGAIPRIGRNAQKFASGIEQPFPDGYLRYLTYFGDADLRGLYTPELAAEVVAPPSAHREHLDSAGSPDWLDQVMHLDLMTFLPALNLTYMDKMAMAHSIEARVPLIDELVVAAMARSTPEQRLQGRRTKILFKQAMTGVVPAEIVTRPKAGFSAPARGWLRNELRPLMHELLSPARVRERGLFKPAAVDGLIASFEQGRRDTALQLWQLLTLELWHSAFLDGAPNSAPSYLTART